MEKKCMVRYVRHKHFVFFLTLTSGWERLEPELFMTKCVLFISLTKRQVSVEVGS